MKLLTQELIKKIPPLYKQEDKGENALAYVKLFTPDSNFNWYITEYDADEKICFSNFFLVLIKNFLKTY